MKWLLFTCVMLVPAAAMAQTGIRPSAGALPGNISPTNGRGGSSLYTRVTDPLEQPSLPRCLRAGARRVDWVRHSALQINPYVRMLSPDKMTYLMIGEPSMPTFAPQSEIDRRLGRQEGLVFDAGLGGRAMIMRNSRASNG